MPKVIARIKGGLGNQLFCYAAARRLAIVNNAALVIDDVTGFVRDRQYRRRYALDHFQIPMRTASPAERMEPFERYRRGFAKVIARRRPFDRRSYVEQEGIDFDPRLLELKVRGTVYLDGLWQSENYFRDIAGVIREDLTIVAPRDADNRETANRIAACNAIAVHVRWFEDPKETSAEHNLECSYYATAIDKIIESVDKARFFVFSDQPDATQRLLNLPEDRVTCIHHNRGEESAYADLWLMSQCKHFIIANSTFSWWGAWLSQHEHKTVISPKIAQSGVSSWGFKGLLPEEWIRI